MALIKEKAIEPVAGFIVNLDNKSRFRYQGSCRFLAKNASILNCSKNRPTICIFSLFCTELSISYFVEGYPSQGMP